MGNQFLFLIFAAHVMHPLRFPNNGIRAKVFVQKIDFKLRVMRLYRVESFYAFLLRFCSEGSKEEGRPAPMQGRPPTARPRPRPASKGRSPAGAAARRGGACGHGGLWPAHSMAPAKGQAAGWRAQVAVASSQPARGCRSQPGRKGRLPTARLQRATARGAPARGGCPRRACKGGGHQRPARKGLLPTDSPITSRGSDADRRGGRPLAGRLPIAKGSHRLRRGRGDGGAVRVKEG
ncbi:hypothetical protein GW17_00061716 [Ensete ventricosum]|nr:hypothetical protein GW17_00061716 [Ensete ventricosum]RZS27687.1 hypothetical protein BHM03_00061204 [Ensete ventricosum]